MKKICITALILLFTLSGHAQEKPVGLAYIDSINICIQSTALELAMLQCLPEPNDGEIEIIPIGSTYFCIIRCATNDKLFEFEYESSSWINIPLPSPEDHKVATIRKVISIYSKDGNILVTLHWDGAEILGNDDERLSEYDDRTFTLSDLQQFARK